MDAVTVPGGVGATAIGVAAVRARESLRRDRLFADPFAQRFLVAAGWPTPSGEIERPVGAVPPRWQMVVLSIPIRTRFLDECLQEATISGCGQDVLLGAGLDTRAFRLDWPAGTTVFELDVPEMVAFKESVLVHDAPRCAARLPVPVDLTEDWVTPLVAAGFDPSVPTAWVAEGLVMYLTEEQNDVLLTTVRGLSAPGSRLALTTLSQGSLDAIADSAADGTVASMWRFGAPADPEAWLAAYGWKAQAYDPAERAAAYGRPGVFDRLAPRPATRGYLYATRED